MSIRITEDSLFAKDENGRLVPFHTFASGTEKTVKELQEYADGVIDASKETMTGDAASVIANAEASMIQRANAQIGRIPEVNALNATVNEFTRTSLYVDAEGYICYGGGVNG